MSPLYPLTAGGLYPLAAAATTSLRDAILGLAPTAYLPMDDVASPLADASGNGWTATVTGSPTYGVAQSAAIGTAITWSGTGQYATTSGSVTTPPTRMSFAILARTTNATAAARFMVSRSAAAQYSWGLQLSAAHAGTINMYQAGGALHASVSAGAGQNDGQWRLYVGTFDGTTLWSYASPGNLAGLSSVSLTGSWNKAATSGIVVGGLITGSLWPGDLAHLAYWSNRVLTNAEFRALASAAGV